MLRKRLVTVLTFCDGVLHGTKVFDPDYRYTLNFIDAWSVDEVVVLDITRPGKGKRENFFKVTRDFAHKAFVPLAVGGGIRSLDDVRECMANGADKVVINTGALDNPGLITEIAEKYGAQCVVVSIDVKCTGDDKYEACAEFGQRSTGKTPENWAQEAVKLGAGEILVTSIEKDGSLEGYDLNLSKKISSSVNVPVLISGGAGAWKHFVDGFEIGGASAVCTSNIYHFTEASIQSAKNFLAKAKIPIRQS